LASRTDDIKGYVKVCGTEGELLSEIDEEGHVALRVLKYGAGESIIKVPETESESVSFQAEIRNFLVSVLEDKESVLNQTRGAEIMAVLGSAYLSNVRKQAVTLDGFKDYVNSFKGHDDVDQKLIDVFMQSL